MTTWAPHPGIAVVVGVAVLVVVVAPAGAASHSGLDRRAGGEHIPDADCGGTGGGAAYVTDSGLTVFENDSAITAGRFPDTETVEFGTILFSAPGPAAVRLENGTGPTTCVAAVNATTNDILIAPDGENNLTVAGHLTDLWFQEVDYTPSDGTADVAYAAAEPTELEIEETGLSPGTTVFVETANGTPLDTAIVADDGSVTVSLPPETHTVDVRLAQPPDFTVTIDATTSPVQAGESVTVTATVENAGEITGTRMVTLSVGEEQSDAREVTLDGGDRRTIDLTWPTAAGDAGEYTAMVDTGDDSDSTTVTVEDAGGDSEDSDDSVTFTVTIEEVTLPETQDGSFHVTATIKNTGNATDTQIVTLTVGDTERDSQEITLEGGEARSVTFTWEQPTDLQESTLRVSSEDDFDVSSVRANDSDEGGGLIPSGSNVPLTTESATSLLLLLLALLLVYYYVRRRRTQD